MYNVAGGFSYRSRLQTFNPTMCQSVSTQDLVDTVEAELVTMLSQLGSLWIWDADVSRKHCSRMCHRNLQTLPMITYCSCLAAAADSVIQTL